jgi:hypothetical protein
MSVGLAYSVSHHNTCSIVIDYLFAQLQTVLRGAVLLQHV